RTLAEVVEPAKDYSRRTTAPAEPTSATPLHRLVDAVPPESETSRRFSEMVDRFIAGGCRDPELEARLRASLILWRDNDAKLQPLAERSFLVKEAAQSSADLAALGSGGLAALDFIAHGEGTDAWKAEQLAILDQVKKPKAQLLLMPAPAVQKLIEAAAAGGGCSSTRP